MNARCDQVLNDSNETVPVDREVVMHRGYDWCINTFEAHVGHTVFQYVYI